MRNRSTRVLVMALALSLVWTVAGLASPDSDDGVVDSGKDVHGHKHEQHGGSDGHLEPMQDNVELVSKLGLKNVVPEKIADVGVHDGYAYLAAWGVVTCKYNGVHVVDVNDPANPEEVAFIPAKQGSYPGEGIQALTIDTSAFSGDILVSNNEKCDDTAGFGGMNIYDISKPTAPTPLSEGFGDSDAAGAGKKDANEIHSVFAWDAGSRAYAVMVDNVEFTDVDIVDITDPRKPKLIAEYDLAEEFPQITQEGMDEVFLHDMIVKEIDGRFVMLLSYWDAGYVQLDVTDPTNIELLADSSYAQTDPQAAEAGFDVPPEGNGHQAEFTLDNTHVIGTDEDFAPYGVSATDSSGNEFAATMGIAIEPGSTLEGPLVFVGRGCDVDGALPTAAEGQLALIERGACTFTEKVGNASDAGYAAAVVFNSQTAAGGGCTALVNMSVEGDIPALFVGRDTAFGFMELNYDDATCTDGDAASGAVPPENKGVAFETITVESFFDGWGYVHLLDGTTHNSLDTYAIPQAHDPQFAFDHGDLSVHEIATSHQRNDLGYLAYYSGGFRVVEVQESTGKGKGKKQQGASLVEVGSFIDEGGNNFWGVEVFEGADGQEYVAASDRDLGLYIFRYTGG